MTAIRPDVLQVDHGLRRQAIVEALLGDVFQGRLRAGQHLVTQKLAERFGVSHTPIREALIWLAGVGVVELLPNRGAVVRSVTARDVREICQVRKLLECQATRGACGQIAPEQLQALADALRALIADRHDDLAGYLGRARQVDSRLHDLIALSCGNAFLAKELGRLKVLFRAFRDQSYTHHEAHREHDRLRAEAHEHLVIVEALQAGDPAGAARAMARHIRSGIRTWGRALPSPN